jgi:hypothetical protein
MRIDSPGFAAGFFLSGACGRCATPAGGGPVPWGVRKLLIILGILFVLLIVAGAAITAVVLLSPGKVRRVVGGETRLLDYLGAQVVGIANAQLVPELSFETIRYDPPYTLSLGGVRLTAPDSTRVLDLGRMEVTLAETPRMGEPIRVASLKLSNGAISLINDPAANGGAGGLRGLSPLVKPRPERERTEAERPEFSLSHVLVLSKIVIEGIDLVYDAGDGSAPMRLDALAADLDIVPVSDTGLEGAGWYELKLASGRKPGLELDLDGRINIDSFELALNRVTAVMQLDDQTATTLPPQLATLVNTHQLRGAVRAVVTGRVPLMDPGAAELDVQAGLTNGRGVFGEYQIPLDSVELTAGMASRVVDLRSLGVQALGGTMTGEGRIALDGDARVSWDLQGMDLREMLASRPADQPPKMAGKVTSTGSVRAPMSDPMAGLSGAGQIDVREGRLVNVPILSDLVSVMQVTGLTGNTLRDSFSSPFTITPAGVRLENFDFRTPAVAARGSGTMGFDGTLDFSVNGGPVESIQNRLGPIGGILGKITDQFVTYRVRGTTAEPKVSVQPLGIGG